MQDQSAWYPRRHFPRRSQAARDRLALFARSRYHPSLSSLRSSAKMLTTVPPEILANIAFHLALPTLSPPVPLLQTCKAIYQTLSPSNNPRLYGRIFRTAFDYEAAERRIGDIHAGDVTQELQRRVQTLRRLKAMTRRGEVEGAQAMDLWIIYIMLIENGALVLVMQARSELAADPQTARISSISPVAMPFCRWTASSSSTRRTCSFLRALSRGTQPRLSSGACSCGLLGFSQDTVRPERRGSRADAKNLPVDWARSPRMNETSGCLSSAHTSSRLSSTSSVSHRGQSPICLSRSRRHPSTVRTRSLPT